MAIGEQRCCRSGGPAFYLCPRALAAMSFVFSLFPAFCLSGVLGLREGVGSRPDSRVPFCARQKGTFTLAWGETHIAKQCGWRPKSASATLSGETHCAPSSLRSNSRRKFEFLYGGTPVLPLACGVAQALRLELPLPLAGEGGGEETCISFPRWGKAGMGANLVGKWPQRRCATAAGFLNEICLWRLCSNHW